MKKILLFSLAAMVSLCAPAQHLTDKWIFGVLAGLDFGSGNPVPISGSVMNASEGCSSVSDSSGVLLFYTDGISVWNANHQLMPNGTGLNGGSSSTQAALIISAQDTSNRYYIFTTDETGGALGLRYSLVDMDLQSGLGDVVQKNVALHAPMTEKLTAVEDLQNGGYWIVGHEWGTDAFYAYKLTASGIQAPVVSHTGLVHRNNIIQNSYGQLKFNTCGDRLAAAIGYQDTIEVFDFDRNTGAVSNPIVLPMGGHVYGVEFSASSRYLYVSTYKPTATLAQLDLVSGISPTIMNTMEVLSTEQDVYGLQMGPNGKIYVCKSYSPYLGEIASPDSAGALCLYDSMAVNLDPLSMGVTSGLGLPCLVQSYLAKVHNCGISVGMVTDPVEQKGVFPNPSASGFRLTMAPPFQASVVVYSIHGGVVEVLPNLMAGEEFGMLYPPGIYLVELRTSSGQTDYFRLIKSR